MLSIEGWHARSHTTEEGNRASSAAKPRMEKHYSLTTIISIQWTTQYNDVFIMLRVHFRIPAPPWIFQSHAASTMVWLSASVDNNPWNRPDIHSQSTVHFLTYSCRLLPSPRRDFPGQTWPVPPVFPLLSMFRRCVRTHKRRWKSLHSITSKLSVGFYCIRTWRQLLVHFQIILLKKGFLTATPQIILWQRLLFVSNRLAR